MSDVRLVIEVAIEPTTQCDRETLAVALAKLATEDSSFGVSIDQESGGTILKGTSERHLDAKLDTLMNIDKVHLRVGAPQIAYRETISRSATMDYTHKKQTGGSGQFARIKIVVEPLPPDGGFVFENEAVGGSVPKQYVASVEKGLESVLGSGVLAGFPVVDLKVTLIDGSYHDVDSSALAFEIAGRMALRETLQEAKPVLLEPIMEVEVVTPTGYVAGVIGDLNARRGRVTGKDARGAVHVITAMVPLACMLGSDSNLASLSRTQATYEMTFSHYAPVPVPDDDGPFRPAVGMRA
jgi:elongation factor G